MKTLYGIKSELSYPGTYDVLMRRHDVITRSTFPTLLYATKEEAIDALEYELENFYSGKTCNKTRIGEDRAEIRRGDETTTLEIVEFKLCDD